MSVYVPTDWVDGTTPVNAANLDKLEQGLAAASQEAIDAAAAAADAAAGNPPDPTGLDEKWLKAESGAMVWVDAPTGGGGVEYENDWSAAVAYQAGDVVRYNGVDYLAVNSSTGQAPPAALPASIPLVTALPASPVDGQEVILCDSVTTPTYQWRLRYVAAKATNKWVFVGGSPIRTEIDTMQTRVPNTYGDLTTVGPSVAAPVAGDYEVVIECEISTAQNVAQPTAVSYSIGATAAVDADAILHSTEGGPNRWKSCIRTRKKSLTAVTLTMKYKGDGTNTMQYQSRVMTLRPVAVGG